MEFDDKLVLLLSKVASLKVRPEVVYPTKAAALAASKQAYTQMHQKETIEH